MKEFMKDFLFFDKLMTPKFIVFIYWLMLLGMVIAGLAIMFAFNYRGITFQSFLMGLFTIGIGAIFIRIWSELLIVLFKMNEALQEIRKK